MTFPVDIKITFEMKENRYFTSNMASVFDLAKRIHESTHHVSQVINEHRYIPIGVYTILNGMFVTT